MVRNSILALVSASALACGSSELHVAGASSSQFVQTFDGRPSSAELGSVRLRPEVCRGVDVRPPGRPLDADDFVAFAKSQGLDARVVQARQDLVFVDIANAGTAAPIRFRVAVTQSAGAAGHELHTALLQHGEGTWGLQRSNLAVLAPPAPADDIVVLAAKARLACWGVRMIAGHDDTFVVPGGYTEL
jgi:hypothetical protein